MQSKTNASKQRNNKSHTKQPKNMQVVVRMRPINKDCVSKFLKVEPELKSISITEDTQKNSYTFSQVFTSTTTQEQLFESLISPKIQRMLRQKKQTLIFTYGVTNSGKTYTILGTPKEPGLLVRSVNALLLFKRKLESVGKGLYA